MSEDNRIIPGSCYGNYDPKITICTKDCVIRDNCKVVTAKIKNGFENKEPIKEKAVKNTVDKKSTKNVSDKVAEMTPDKPFDKFMGLLMEKHNFSLKEERGAFVAYFFEDFHIVLDSKSQNFQVIPDSGDKYVVSAMKNIVNVNIQVAKLAEVIDAH